MSKIVVGMNSRPAIMPQRIDCGLRNTVASDCPASRNQLSWLAGASERGNRTSSNAPITIPAQPMPIQNELHGMPAAMAGPTMNCPAEPPAMPNIWVAPISVAAREGGKFFDAM